MFKKIISGITLAAIVLTMSACDAEVSMTAQEAAEKMGVGINLGNTLESCFTSNYKDWISVVGNNTPLDYETFWGAVETTQEVIDGMKAEGFDTVRVPVYWGNMMEDDGTYTLNPEYAARVKEVVDYCQKAGLYTVINIHHFDEFIIRRHDTEECKEIFTIIWKQIAEYFKDYSYKLIFEGYNEYLGGGKLNSKRKVEDRPKEEAYELTNVLNQAFVDAVRSTGGKNAERVLIISGYWTNIDLTTAPEYIVPTDSAEDRLMVSVHYVDNAFYWAKRIGSDEWLQYIDDQIALLKNAFLDKNIPVFMGETSSKYPEENIDGSVSDKTSSKYVKTVLEKLLENDIVPVLWDVNDNFYSRTEYRIKADDERQMIADITEKIHERNS